MGDINNDEKISKINEKSEKVKTSDTKSKIKKNEKATMEQKAVKISKNESKLSKSSFKDNQDDEIMIDASQFEVEDKEEKLQVSDELRKVKKKGLNEQDLIDLKELREIEKLASLHEKI